MSKVTEREGCTSALAFAEDQLRHDLAKKIWQKTNTMTMTGCCKTVGIWGRFKLCHMHSSHDSAMSHFSRKPNWHFFAESVFKLNLKEIDKKLAGACEQRPGSMWHNWRRTSWRSILRTWTLPRRIYSYKKCCWQSAEFWRQRLIEERSRLDERLSSVKSQRAENKVGAEQETGATSAFVW